MAKTLTTMINIAFKRLLGKANTSVKREDYEETIASNIQISNTSIFASQIPSPPVNDPAEFTLYDKDGNVCDGSTYPYSTAVAEFLIFSCSEVPAVNYISDKNLSGESTEHDSQQTRTHAYALSLPDNYTSGGSNKNLTAATTFGIGGITGSEDLQVIPSSFGARYGIKLFESSSNQIVQLDDIDWQFDPFSGIIFVQDNPNNSFLKVPKTATAYLYVGNYQKDLDVGDHTNNSTVAKQKLFNAYEFNQEATFITGSGSSFQNNDLGDEHGNYYFLNKNIILGSEQVFANGLLQQSSSRGKGATTGQVNDYLIYPSSSNPTMQNGITVPTDSTIFEFTYPVSSSLTEGKVLVTYLPKDS